MSSIEVCFILDLIKILIVLVYAADCRRQVYPGIAYLAEPLQIQRKGLKKGTGRIEELVEIIK